MAARKIHPPASGPRHLKGVAGVFPSAHRERDPQGTPPGEGERERRGGVWVRRGELRPSSEPSRRRVGGEA